MITERTNLSEMIDESMIDYYQLWDALDNITKPYKRLITKSNKFPLYFQPKQWKSKNKNNYLIFFEAQTKKDKDRIIFSIVGLFEKKGINAFMISNQHKIYLYPPHFWKRFRERFLMDERITTIDSIKRFFKFNGNVSLNLLDNNMFEGTVSEGVIFGEIVDGVHIVKTFVSKEMLFDSQKNTMMKASERLEIYKKYIV